MANPNQDGWDWPYIIYIGRVWLKYTDKETWALTPRQFASQLSVHEEITKQMHGNGSKSSTPTANSFIDQIPGW